MTEISRELVERMASFMRNLDKWDGSYALASDRTEARSIVALLPKPVDPDLIEARLMAAEAHPTVATTNFIDGRADSGCAVQYRLEGIKRGRLLARTHDGIGLREGSDGMTLRDWFAGQALAGMLASEGPEQTAAGFYKSDWAADRSYEIADAMIRARTKEAGE